VKDELGIIKAIEPRVTPATPDEYEAERERLAAQIAGKGIVSTEAISEQVSRPRSRFVLVGAGVIAATLLFAGLFITGRSGDDGGGKVQAGSSSDGVALSPSEIELMLTPATPDDFNRLAKPMLVFESKAGNALARKCYAENGYPDADVVVTTKLVDQQYRYFEDPAVLRSRGFGVFADKIPAPPGPDGAAPPAPGSIAAPADVIHKCAEETSAAIAPVLTLFNNLHFRWMEQVKDLESSQAMQPAWEAWSNCMAGKGYDVANDDSFYALVDRTLASPGASQQAEVTMATAYADCIESGVLQARADARNGARGAFIANNADAFTAAQDGLERAVQQVSAASGVAYAG
jgi:hypothetical protein